MNYLLVKEEQLSGQGYDCQYNERIPDGRIILPLSALKVLSNFTPEIISDDSLLLLIKKQKESGLYNKEKEEVTDGVQGDNQETETPPATENPPVIEEGGTAV